MFRKFKGIKASNLMPIILDELRASRGFEADRQPHPEDIKTVLK
jgi:hypothetical protein